MGKGREVHDPRFSYTDPYSGREISQLTNYLGHSSHLYFTDPCWFNNDRSLVFTSDRENWSNLFRSTHFHSLDETIIVGDGTPAMRGNAQSFIQLFKRDGQQYVGPRVLAFHRSTFNDQHAHCHPRFTPDGKSVLYSSDLGLIQICIWSRSAILTSCRI